MHDGTIQLTLYCVLLCKKKKKNSVSQSVDLTSCIPMCCLTLEAIGVCQA